MSSKIAANPDLHPDQIKQIKNLDLALKKLMTLNEEFKSFADFKLGDVFIEEQWDEYNPADREISKNHMGFPYKFKVVHVSDQGIPYLRQLNPNGNPTGPLRAPPHKAMLLLEQLAAIENRVFTYKFVPDPEALDSILLQQEFLPMASHKTKLQLFNEITKHNKAITIKTNDSGAYNNVRNFFKSLQPGAIFWTSPANMFVIQSITKTGKQWNIVCVDQNKATHTFNFAHFMYKRLYTAQPRSFTQESDT